MQDATKKIPFYTAVLDAYLDHVKHLPPKPTIMIKLIELFRRPEVDADEIVALLRRDPALSLEVLRRCNSAFFGLDTPVMDINEAVFRIGFYEVYQITITLFGMQMMTPKEKVPGFSAETLQQHSCIAAIAAGALALDLGESEGIAFTAGLLHDVGKIVLALGEREKYVAIMEDCQRTGASLSETEKTLFGFNHEEVGARLLQRWGMPADVVTPVLSHNDQKPAGESHRFVLITNLASRLANYIQTEKTKQAFIQLPGVKTLIDSLKLGDERALVWEGIVRNKVRQQNGNPRNN